MRNPILTLDEDENESIYRPSDFVEKDLDLLVLLILIEIAHSKRKQFYLNEFFKGNYWTNEDLVSEIFESNDYSGIPDMILGQIMFLFEDLKIGKIEKIGVDDLNIAFQDLAQNIHDADGDDPQFRENYGYAISHYAELYRKVKNAQEEKINDNVANWLKLPTEERQGLPLFFPPETAIEKLGGLIIETPERILIHADFNREKIYEIEKEITRYLTFFVNDKQESQPPYLNRRTYYTKQVENFHEYIHKLPQVGNVFHLPFQILNEKGFEVIKLLRHLQEKKIMNLKWSDTNFWRVEFISNTITIAFLLGSSNANTSENDEKLKLNLSFNYETGELIIGDNKVRIRGNVQKELLRIVFSDPKESSRSWFFSEIAEEFDRASNLSVKKFYNAAYQINKNIAQQTTIKDFLITTNQTMTINPSYTPKS